MKKRFLGALTVVVVIAYLLGPKLNYYQLSSELPQVEINIQTVAQYVANMESKFDIKPDNEARIIWNNDSLKNRTSYCILYLHGFSASWYEGYPSHINVARSIGANLYLSRLAGHGLVGDDAMLAMEPSQLYESAKEALIIAKSLGDKIIIMGTSTGGTLALKLAADFPNIVNSIVLLSPNVAINSGAAPLLSGPWGLQIARLSGGGDYRDLGPAPLKIEEDYWARKYPWEATVYLQQLIDETMTEAVFEKVEQPLFLGYYYKDEENQDNVVRVDAMLKMFDQIATKDYLKHKVAFPDAGTHVIGCRDLSGAANEVEIEVTKFLKTNI